MPDPTRERYRLLLERAAPYCPAYLRKEIQAALKKQAEHKYHEIAAVNPVQAQFLPGWLARLEKGLEA